MMPQIFTRKEYTNHLEAIDNFSLWTTDIRLLFTAIDQHTHLAEEAANVQKEGLYSLKFIMRFLSEQDFPQEFNKIIEHCRTKSAFIPGVTKERAIAFNKSIINAFSHIEPSGISADSLLCILEFYLHIHNFISRLLIALENHPSNYIFSSMPMYSASVISKAFLTTQNEYTREESKELDSYFSQDHSDF